MRPWLLLLALASMATACGSQSGTDLAVATAAVAAETSTTSSTNTSPPTTLEPDPPATRTSRSLLSVVDDVPERGSFRLVPGRAVPMPAAEGWFWRLEDGSIHTRFDVDEELIATEMARLADALDGERDAVAYIDSLRSHYRGADFQLGILDLVDYLGLMPVDTDILEQLGYFADADDRASAETAAALDRCLTAMAGWRVEADGFLSRIEPDFRLLERANTSNSQLLMPDVMRWEIPIEEMLVANPIPAPCVELLESTGSASPDARAGLDVRLADTVTVVDVWFDDGRFAEPREQTALTLHLTPGTKVEPPSDRAPEALFSRLNTFLVTIDECGELPWIYSDFAAGNTYHPPLSSGYNGPTFLDSNWLCEERVPERR